MSPSRTNIASVPSPDEDASTPLTAQQRRQHLDKALARRVTAVACLACQRRKSKCDGARPTCLACLQRGGTCGYETADGLTRLADLKHKNNILTSRNSRLERVFAKLRSEDDNEATGTLARLRLGDEISQILGVVDDADRPRTPSYVKSIEPGLNFGSGLAGQDNWRPSSPTSQTSTQSPTASITNLPYQPYRSLSQARALEIPQRQWIMPFGGMKHALQSTTSTSTWFTDGDGRRRASSSSVQMSNPSVVQFAPGMGGVIDPALHIAKSYMPGSTNRRSDLVHPDHGRGPRQGVGSQQGTKQLDDQHRAGRPRVDERRNSSLAEAIDVLAPEQHMDTTMLKTYESAASLPSGISDGSIPVWAILPKHKYDQHPSNTAILSFMFAKRAEIGQGASPDSFMGPAPALEGLFDQQAFAAVDDLSRWAARFGVTFFEVSTLQVVVAHMAWYLMRWMIFPTPETYQAIPPWLRPTPDQLLIPHTISTDFLHNPQFRDAVLRSTVMQENSDWLEELSSLIDCNWPHSIEAGLERDGETGCLGLNPLLRDRIDNMDNWSISSRLRAFMPNADTYLQLRLPED